MYKSISHSQASYQIPHFSVRGHVCKTNLPSNTAFRAFGTPQAMLTAETFIEDIAAFLGKDPMEVQYSIFLKKNWKIFLE
jgi:xanthine dehydrogenase molybdopterin-binding subunit B